jgi:hypothetical protein
MTDTVITSIAELTDFVRSTHVECTDDGTVHVVSVVDGSLISRGHPSLRSPLAVSTVVALFNHTYETELSGSVEAESDRWLQLFRIAVLSVSQCVRDGRQGSVGQEPIELLRASGTSDSTQKTGLELWVEHSCLIAAVQRVFREPSPAIADVKKIALDVGYLLLTQRLDFNHSSLGLVAPLRRCDVAVASLFAQLLESFMVTAPAHFPFMPARHFAPVHWPIAVSESCSGKVHSLFRFPDQSIPGEVLRYCNYTTVQRRQPWPGRLSALQLIEVAINALDTQTSTPHSHPFCFASKEQPSLWNESPIASLEECDALVALLRGVVRRLRDVDPKLLYRTALHAVDGAPTCQLCSCGVGNIFERLNPLRSAAAGAALRERALCQLCLRSVCTACIAPATTYVGDQVCLRCDGGLEALSLRDLTKTRRRLRFLAPRLTQAALAQHQKRLVGDEVLGGAFDEANEGEEDGADSPCCSETMSESLKDWRDHCSVHSGG